MVYLIALWHNISNMKKFIGTKVIMAEPMTMVKALKELEDD